MKPLLKRRWFRILALVLVAGVGGAIWFQSILKGELSNPKASKLILDRRGQYLGEVPGTNDALGYWPLPPVIPEKIVVATIETEDRFFYLHGGVHLASILRALYQNIINGRVVSGASTIAMQVARMQTPGSRNLFRKIKEAAEARLLVAQHGHDRVLRHYLTIAPYGNRVHGIRRAARYYFNKPIEDLSWLQTAFLVGLPQAPGRMDPHRHKGLKRALARAHRVLNVLFERDRITEEEYRQALLSDLRLVDKPHRRPEAMHAVLRWSKLTAGRDEHVFRSTIDLETQAKVARVLASNLRRRRYRGAGNTSGLVVDLQSGDILAYLGSADYFDEEDRGAIDYVRTKRSPGSALKPFIYALALQKGVYTAASELSDIRVVFSEGRGPAYVPRNITHTFLGPMLLRDALANSRNIPALHALAEVGVEPALAFFEKCGVEGVSYQPGSYGLGLALGNLNVTLEELTGLYAVLANDGRTLPFRRFLGQPVDESRRVLSKSVAQSITHILADPLARVPSFRRGSALEYEYAVAVKTGTSQGYRDAWAVAYSDRLLVGVWVGNHDWRRMNRLGGLVGAADAVHRIMDALMPRHRPHVAVKTEFPPPDGYLGRTVCSLSGKLAGPDCLHHRLEYFAPGSEPQEFCAYHRKVKIDRRNGLLASYRCPARFIDEQVLVDLPGRYEPWARSQHLEIAPKTYSPLCARVAPTPDPRVTIREPREKSRFLWDPDTPAEFATIRLAANVSPRTEEIVWIVDGVPVAKVGYPHEYRWSLEPGTHVIEAAMARRPHSSRPVTVVVSD